MGTFWADVSQYQRVVDDSYPHRVFSFRTNSGDKLDTNAAGNLAWATSALQAGRIDIVIAYYFFRPGQANCDLWREVVSRSGSIHPRIVCMVDVEGANGSVRGDNSAEINGEIQRVQGWLGGGRVIGYLNPKADPGLWPTRPNVPLVVPHYNDTPGQSYDFPNRFAHQYSDAAPCAPFGPCDANYTDLDIPGLLRLFGITEGGSAVGVPEDLQLQSRGPALKGWPSTRYHETDGSRTSLSQTDYLRAIDAKENSNLDLADRPRDPKEKDDQFGHVLSTHALVLENNRLLRALAEKAGLDADTIAKGGK